MLPPSYWRWGSQFVREIGENVREGVKESSRRLSIGRKRWRAVAARAAIRGTHTLLNWSARFGE